VGRLTLDQPNVAGARAFRRFFRREFHALAFSQELEDCAAHGAAMEEVLDAAFIAYESETFVDEEACDSPGRHSRVLRCAKPETTSQALHDRWSANYEATVKRSGHTRAPAPESSASVGSPAGEVKARQNSFNVN
jgi:hypothetical protein